MNGKLVKNEKSLSIVEDLIENLPIGMMILDDIGTIIKMNKKQEETSRIERKEVIGKTFEEAFSKTLQQGLRKHYVKLLKSGTPFDVIIDRYTPQYYSKLMTYHARGAAFSSRKHFIILHELEAELFQEKRRAERRTKELVESKNFLESLIDASPSILISTDLSGRILIFNKTAEKIFGYKEKEVMKKKVTMLFIDSPPLDPRDDKGPNILNEVLCVKKNQTTFPASVQISDIKDIKNKSVAKLYLLSDLTAMREMQERLFLSEKLALYSELMGGIAHQLNNPLVGVVNFSEMLLREMEREDPKRDLAETISRAGKECLKIITSVLNCIKDPYLTFSEMDVHKVLKDALHALEEQFGERLKDVSVTTNMDKRIQPVFGDVIQMKQCFLNILINAMQAIKDGGRVHIDTHYDEIKKEVRISFSDTGIGVPKEYINKIFLPFFSVKKDSGRHGLGLSFAYQIIKNHGGNIHAESELGLGSTFTITLPAG